MNIKKIALIGVAVFLIARYLGNRTTGTGQQKPLVSRPFTPGPAYNATPF